jgi:hypothetical protein
MEALWDPHSVLGIYTEPKAFKCIGSIAKRKACNNPIGVADIKILNDLIHSFSVMDIFALALPMQKDSTITEADSEALPLRRKPSREPGELRLLQLETNNYRLLC